MKKILVTGSTGFTGPFVVKALRDSGFDVTCFVRNTQKAENCLPKDIPFCVGNFEDRETFSLCLKGKDALVNVASIGFGHAQGIIEACRDAGVRRTVFFSSTALFTTLEAKTKSIRLAAEKAIKDSGLNFTIIRPTMIYGTPGDRNMIRLIRFLDRFPLIPVLGDGESLQQPVFVKDLAKAVTSILNVDATIGKAYNLSGKEPLPFNQVIDITAKNLGKSVVKIHIPLRPSIALVKAIAMVPGLPHITPEQVLRLNENKAFDHSLASSDFGYEPLSFSDGIGMEIQEYMSSSKTSKSMVAKPDA